MEIIPKEMDARILPSVISFDGKEFLIKTAPKNNITLITKKT